MGNDSSKRSVLFLRCPEDLRERLAAAAKRSLRSLNNEAVYRLQESLKQTTADEAKAYQEIRAERLRAVKLGRKTAPAEQGVPA